MSDQEREFLAVFSKKLRHYLSINDMTQKDLADALGVGTSSVHNWVAGLKAPRMDKVDAMCRIFNCRRSDLMKENPQGAYYYINPDTARLAQEMFDDPDMRALFDMKRNMDPERFQAHMDMMKRLYKLEHPEEFDDTGC